MFIKSDLKLLAGLLLVSACASSKPAERPRVQEPIPVAPDSVAWVGDEDLAPILTKSTITPFITDAADRVEQRLGPSDFANRLADVSEDTTAPWVVRVNALRFLSQRGALEQFPVFVEALHAKEEVVRVSAVTFMREYMAVRPNAATELLVAALKDPAMRVQSAALQLLGDRDLEALREYARTTTFAEMRVIAMDVLRAAEERGAPLIEKDSSGTLERTTSNGTVLTFRPTTRWKDWDAAAGDLIVTLPKSKPVVIASNVEAVGRVVPAFFSADYKTLVYEVNREIHTRDLTTGADKKLVDGIAPRILPFSNDIVYMSEVRAKRIESPNNVGMKFDVMRIPLAGGTPASLGQVNANALNNVKGNYANVRWTRIREDEGYFVLVGDNIDFKLPSPFGGQ